MKPQKGKWIVKLETLNFALTHPYQCTECQERFQKVYDAKEHYITTHQNSNESANSDSDEKVISKMYYVMFSENATKI